MDKKCIKSKLIPTPPFFPNRASHSRLPLVSYLSLVYIKASARTIHDETIFVVASNGRLSLHTEMVITSNYVLSVLVISFISTLKFIRKRFLLQTFSQIRRTFTKKFCLNKSWKRFEISFSTNYAQIFQKVARNNGGALRFHPMSPCWPSSLDHLTNYIHLWINLFITFTGRFAGIKCLIYSLNMSEK